MSSRLACKPRAVHYFSINTPDHLINHLGLSSEASEMSDLDDSSRSTTKTLNKSSSFLSFLNNSSSQILKTTQRSVPISLSTSSHLSTPKTYQLIDSKNTTPNSNRASATPKRIIVKSSSPVSGGNISLPPKGSDVLRAFSRTGSAKKLKIRPIIRCRSAAKTDRSELKSSISSILKELASVEGRDNLDKVDETSFDMSISLHSFAKALDNSTDSASKGMSSLSLYVTQTKPLHSRQSSLDNVIQKDPTKESDMIYKDHLEQTFESMKFVRSLQPADVAQIKQKKIRLAKRSGYENKKTIIFDLDETLVHCCESVDSNPDVILPIKFPSGEVVKAGINIRPFCREVLRESNKDYEVIVFTASHKCYADIVLNYLDPTGELIHHRLYRDNCIISDSIFIKDLRILNRRLNETVIVDNAAYSFAYQLDNGIPIISWYDDKNDLELKNLISYLKTLAKEEDIRELNQKTFKLKGFYEEYRNEFKCLDVSSTISTKSSNGKRVKAVPFRVIRKYCT